MRNTKFVCGAQLCAMVIMPLFLSLHFAEKNINFMIRVKTTVTSLLDRI